MLACAIIGLVLLAGILVCEICCVHNTNETCDFLKKWEHERHEKE